MSSDKKRNAILGKRTGFSREEDSKSIVIVDNSADELNKLHQSILSAGKNMVRFAIEAGEILSLKKKELNHGEFIPWVENNLTFKIRTAQRYIKIFEKRDSINASTLTHLEDAYKLLAGPLSEERELNSIDVQDPDPKELYSRFRSGSKLNQKEKLFLKKFLTEKRENILQRANQQISDIDKDLAHLQ
ncbi:DUF3102 domain-containing protein [Leptospira santarosai]|uniref:DUF3102 domain-containing protein n=1 Tax=Leptospira santarosai TaxID=28183 RepID=UPI0024AF4C9B|nr:DUF3102 domain-containing protein [Leptospira santarosai]MDI7218835.1 DUF3102 domain-containing protein [Leptospira santarosai]